jgi:hypothetical protein
MNRLKKRHNNNRASGDNVFDSVNQSIINQRTETKSTAIFHNNFSEDIDRMYNLENYSMIVTHY